MDFEKAFSKHHFTKKRCEKILILCFLMNEQVTRKKINLRKLFFMNNVRTSARSSLQYLICIKSKQVSI